MRLLSKDPQPQTGPPSSGSVAAFFAHASQQENNTLSQIGVVNSKKNKNIFFSHFSKKISSFGLKHFDESDFQKKRFTNRIFLFYQFKCNNKPCQLLFHPVIHHLQGQYSLSKIKGRLLSMSQLKTYGLKLFTLHDMSS